MAGYMNNGGGYYNPYPSISTGYPNYVQLQQMQNYQQMQQPQPQQTNGSNGLPYVHGIEGAHAFPMPQGVNRIILWDDTVDSFYIKGYDGRSMHNMPMNDGPWGYDNRYYDQGSGRRYYDDNMRGSGRRYYDGEKDTSVAYLRRMMDSETRPEMKTAMQNVIKELEMR